MVDHSLKYQDITLYYFYTHIYMRAITSHSCPLAIKFQNDEHLISMCFKNITLINTAENMPSKILQMLLFQAKKKQPPPPTPPPPTQKNSFMCETCDRCFKTQEEQNKHISEHQKVRHLTFLYMHFVPCCPWQGVIDMLSISLFFCRNSCLARNSITP